VLCFCFGGLSGVLSSSSDCFACHHLVGYFLSRKYLRGRMMYVCDDICIVLQLFAGESSVAGVGLVCCGDCCCFSSCCCCFGILLSTNCSFCCRWISDLQSRFFGCLGNNCRNTYLAKCRQESHHSLHRCDQERTEGRHRVRVGG
jgi:hypothetical protein